MTTTSRGQHSTTAKHETPSRHARMTWLLDGSPVRSPWRLLAAIGAVGQAVAHLPVLEEHLSDAPDIGDDVGNWGEPLGIVAIIAEGIMLITAAVQLGRLHHD